MMRFVQVKVSKNGRYAILARKTENDPWVQVESVLGRQEANKFAFMLEHDDTERYGTIEANDEVEWENEDKPVE